MSWMFPFVLKGLDMSLQYAWLSGCALIAQFRIVELNILWNYLITWQMSITWIAFSKERGYKKRNYNLEISTTEKEATSSKKVKSLTKRILLKKRQKRLNT